MTDITTLGRELLRRGLPDKYKDRASQPWNKKLITNLTTEMALDDPDAYVDVLQRLNALGERVVSLYGRDAALSYADTDPGEATARLNAKMRQLIDSVLDDPELSEEQKEERIKELGYRYTKRVSDAVFADQDARHTSLASQLNSGSRGNPTQLMQLMFGNMMMKDALNRDIPYLHIDPFVYGTSPMSYWVSSSAGRKGMYDVQAATGQAGYLGKQVTNVTHDVVIEERDCGTRDTGMAFPADSQQNVGRVLLRPFHGHPAGEVVTSEMVSEAGDGEEMILRTPMTCKCRHGVCAKCNGLDENGRFPSVGDYVSLNSARAFVEKVTQAGISSKHGSGVGGKKNEDPDGADQPTGFRGMERMFMAPANFPGGAVLAPEDGTVGSIRPAAQGGSYVTVGSQTLYAPPEREFKVRPGDRVTAGDALTNGVPNPMEVVRYKGLGDGRRYYMDKLDEIFRKAGFGVDRSNLESFSRAMINRVEITDPDGYGPYLPGDIVSYSELAADYRPRKDAVREAPDKALNKYLERPALHYSIGTRITPRVADDLSRHGFGEIEVSPTEPPFRARFMRPAAVLQNDRHWLPRLAGERLFDSLFDAAQRGLTDEYDSTSYVDKIVTAPFRQ